MPCLQLCDDGGCTEVSHNIPSRDEILSKLRVFIDEMTAAEELVVPALRWDPVSADAKEVLAVARVGLLISAYEPQYYWCETSLSRTIAQKNIFIADSKKPGTHSPFLVHVNLPT